MPEFRWHSVLVSGEIIVLSLINKNYVQQCKKSDTWFMIDPKTGNRETVLGFGAPPDKTKDSIGFATSRAVYLGRWVSWNDNKPGGLFILSNFEGRNGLFCCTIAYRKMQTANRGISHSLTTTLTQWIPKYPRNMSLFMLLVAHLEKSWRWTERPASSFGSGATSNHQSSRFSCWAEMDSCQCLSQPSPKTSLTRSWITARVPVQATSSFSEL